MKSLLSWVILQNLAQIRGKRLFSQKTQIPQNYSRIYSKIARNVKFGQAVDKIQAKKRYTEIHFFDSQYFDHILGVFAKNTGRDVFLAHTFFSLISINMTKNGKNE